MEAELPRFPDKPINEDTENPKPKAVKKEKRILEAVPREEPRKLPTTLLEHIELLESLGGNLRCYIGHTVGPKWHEDAERLLLPVYKQLDDNPELKKRWRRALAIGHEIRLERAKEKAFCMIERFYNPSKTSASAEVSFIKLVLDDFLVANRTAALKGPTIDGEEDEEVDELDQLEQGRMKKHGQVQPRPE